MQTQCPQCRTAFRVSDEQLGLADGKVRCGQCLHVFVATEHFLDSPPSEVIEPITADDLSIPDIDTDTPLVEVELEASELEPTEPLTTDFTLAEIEVPEIEIPSLDSLEDNPARRRILARKQRIHCQPAEPSFQETEQLPERLGTVNKRYAGAPARHTGQKPDPFLKRAIVRRVSGGS